MAATTSGYPSRDGGLPLHNNNAAPSGPASTTSSCAAGFGFGIPTANGSEDHCNVALAGLFQQIMNDMKGSTFAWEDFLTKSSRLHAALKSTLVASSAFLDAFQRVADVATNARGATKEIGKCLTRMVLRQRSIEAKMKTFASSLMDCLVTPLQEKMEDWKKTCLYMDKEHAKEYKKCRQEIKKRGTDTIRLQKKAKKAGHSKPSSSHGTNWGTIKPGMFSTGSGSSKAMEAWNDLVEMKRQLQDKEFEAVRQAMVEERSRFCLFVSCLKPFLDEELSMLSEMVHLEEITDSLMQHSADPFQLPPASIQAILDVKATCSSTVSATDIMMQDHLANDTYYSSSCSSGSNQWGNYMSPPNSPLQEEPSSPRGTKDDALSLRESHADSISVMGGRHGSICSIMSTASTSSYASSDVSSCSYGRTNLEDKTLCPAPKPYRRCLSDNNASDQHYYPSSITSSIVENDAESDGEDTGLNDTLVNGSQRRKLRPRRSSLSQSEDLDKHYPLSLAVRNEYYSTIRFSSISSGDSGFISHPDQILSSASVDPSDQDNLLTPTTQNGGRSDDYRGGTWSSPPPAVESGVTRRPPIPPFSSVLRGDRTEPEGNLRAHTVAYNGLGNVMCREDMTSSRQGMRNAKRPPLTQDTFVPPNNGTHQGPYLTASKECRKVYRSESTLSHPNETVYANSDLLNDTTSLPPPPEHWMDADGVGRLKDACGGSNTVEQRVGELEQMTVSMTIRRVKEKEKYNSYAAENPKDDQTLTESQRKQSVQDRQFRRHSQIYGSPTNPAKPPPPPLPIRRTPSLHQSMSDIASEISLTTPPTESSHARKSQDQSRTQRSHSSQSSSETHLAMINSLQERLRQSARAPGHPAKSSVDSSSFMGQTGNQTSLHSNHPPVTGGTSMYNRGNSGGTLMNRPTGMPRPTGHSSTGNKMAEIRASASGAKNPSPPKSFGCPSKPGDLRNGLFDQIRNGAFTLRKVSPAQCRDRSSPFLRR